MPKSGTLTKTNLIDTLAETNKPIRKKSVEILGILLEFIKQPLESSDEVGLQLNPKHNSLFLIHSD